MRRRSVPTATAIPAKVGRRICVIGTSGSGKTHVARELAGRLHIPYISNDAIIWRANWQETPADERIASFDAATSLPAWTIDGNLDSKAEDQLVLRRCDTVVWLDLPRWQVHAQVIARTLYRLVTREPLWHGNKESIRMMLSRDSVIWWSIKTFARRRRTYGALFANPPPDDRVWIRLRSRGEVNRWLQSVVRVETGSDA